MTESKTTTQDEVTTEQTQDTTLTPLEEQVVRMRHGFKAPNELALETKAQDNPEVAEQLFAIEKRALEAVGARNNPTKRKIVSNLRKK